MITRRRPFLIFGKTYQVVGEPCAARLIRVDDGLTIAYYGKSWSPREVIAEATHDARVFTGRVQPAASPLTALLTALVLTVAVTSGAWAKGKPDVGPPTDKPGPTIPVSVAAEHEVQASWQWYVAYGGYLELGPFASFQACLVALRRFPQRFKCIPVRD